MSIRDAISLGHQRHTLKCGEVVQIRRPTLGDIVEALEANRVSPATANAHMLARHVLDESGEPIWADGAAAMNMSALTAQELIPLVEALYSEGQD